MPVPLAFLIGGVFGVIIGVAVGLILSTYALEVIGMQRQTRIRKQSTTVKRPTREDIDTRTPSGRVLPY